jgi:putative ABC transport system permease protein
MIRTLLTRCASLLRKRRLDKDLDDELLSHIDLAVEENMRHGMAEAEARSAALRAFGGVTQIRETYREQRGLPFFELLWSDLRYAFRQLWKSPGFTLATVLTLAIGIGVNTAVFSMMDAEVLRPVAVPELDRVMNVTEEHGHDNDDYPQVALGNYQDWKQQSRSFETLSVRSYANMSLTGAGDATHVVAALTSASFFTVLQTNPLLGRTYGERESEPGHNTVAMLSYAFWKKHFAADPAVLGRSINLDERAYTIVGVLPKSMQYPSISDVFLPLAPTPQQLQNRIAHDYAVVGRLRPGVSVREAQEELRVIAAHAARTYPSSNVGWSVRVKPLLDGINGELTPMFYKLILSATGFVLLVVCANVANLQVVRGLARRPEIAVRMALGAGRRRLLRQLLTENILLGGMGAAGGIGIAAVFMHVCVITMPDRIARYIVGWSNVSLNGRALAFSLLLAIASGMISGLLPAMKALRVDLVTQLKAGSRTTTGNRETHRLRDVFAVAQISLSVLLVIGAALMSKGMWSMLRVADVRQPKQVLTFTVGLPPARYGTDEKRGAWFRSSLAGVRTLPGVGRAEITTTLPNGQDGWSNEFQIENRPAIPGKSQSAVQLTVTSGYFDALHIPRLTGRTFSDSDTLDTQPVAMVSHKFAEVYFPGQNPIGHRLQMGPVSHSQAPWVRIVGIVDDVNYLWVDRAIEPAVYLNVTQMPPPTATFVVTTTGAPLTLVPLVQRTLALLDPAVPLDEVQTYASYLAESLTGLIYAAAIVSMDGFIALLLAAIGIFGVMANMVAERTGEIGVRIALGARPGTVLRMILRRTALLTACGVVAGTVLAVGLARLSANLLFGVQPNDPVVFVSIIAAISLIAFLVSWGPAHRAASINPMTALRTE